MDYHLSTTWAVVLAAAAIWELVWKGFGLWRSSQNKQPGWFFAILIINSLGLLPLIYLLLFNRDTAEFAPESGYEYEVSTKKKPS